jgi:hypothetical protein
MAVTQLGPGEGSHRWPQFLPDGRRFIFFSTLGSPETQGVYVASLDGGAPRRVLMSETPAVFVPPDRLLLVRGDALMSAKFDATQAAVTGELMPLAQPVAGTMAWWPAPSPRHQGRSHIEQLEAASRGNSSGWIALGRSRDR